MVFHVQRTATYRCSLERAFKAPMLGDIRRVHTGLGPMPRVTHTTDDADWGRVGSRKRVFMGPTLGFAGGYASMDEVVERVEGVRWVIQVSDLQQWMFGFTRFVGTWETAERAPGEVAITYTYALHAGAPWLGPVQWVFSHTFWRIYMGQVLENVRKIAEGDEPFAHGP